MPQPGPRATDWDRIIKHLQASFLIDGFKRRRVMSSIKDFTLALSDLKLVGKDLSRPEFVLPDNDGTLWISDRRGLVTRLDTDGT